MDATHFTSARPAPQGAALAVHGVVLDDSHLGEAAPPEWVMLIPTGEFSGRDGRGPFRLSDPAAVIAATNELAMAAGLPIDYDHATDFAAPKGRPAPAAGWICELAAREGALWGRVEWTPHGAMAIASREYRYISPVFQYTAEGEVMRLLRAGLTNNPNLYLTAISARAAASAGHARDGIMHSLLDELRKLLGLPDEASAEEALAAVRALLSGDADDDAQDAANGEASAEHERGAEGARADGGAMSAGGADADPARYVPVAQFQKVLSELNRMRAQGARERAERAVDEAIRAGKLIPAQREWAVSYCQADVDGFAAFVARQPAVFGVEVERAAADIAPPRQLGRAGANALSAVETAICVQLGVNAQDYLRRRRGGHGDFLRLNHGGE
ncbi:MAG TPA: phage protease [Candidatus Binataceae bacterium]|nr:phage protease [Candidatus Binataceae bacterium]